jgi:hypothetical protein
MIYNMNIRNKLRLFVNTELPSWETAVHLTTLSRLYSGHWFNYNIYKVYGFDDNGVLHLHSFSSIEHLENNINPFYCYYGYNRAINYEKSTHKLLTYVQIDTPNKVLSNRLINVPSIIKKDDRIIIYDNSGIKDDNPIINLLDSNNTLV